MLAIPARYFADGCGGIVETAVAGDVERVGIHGESAPFSGKGRRERLPGGAVPEVNAVGIGGNECNRRGKISLRYSVTVAAIEVNNYRSF